jgi:putative proteasome-type protease
VEEQCEYFLTLRQQWHRGIQDLMVGLEPPHLD